MIFLVAFSMCVISVAIPDGNNKFEISLFKCHKTFITEQFAILILYQYTVMQAHLFVLKFLYQKILHLVIVESL